MIYEEAMALDKPYSFHETPPLLQVCSVMRSESHPQFLRRVNSVRVPLSITAVPIKTAESTFRRLAKHEKQRLSEIPSKMVSKLERVDFIVQYDASIYDDTQDSGSRMMRGVHRHLKSIELSVYSDMQRQYTVSSKRTSLKYHSVKEPRRDFGNYENFSTSLRWLPRQAFGQDNWPKSDTSELIEAVENVANDFRMCQECIGLLVSYNLDHIERA